MAAQRHLGASHNSMNMQQGRVCVPSEGAKGSGKEIIVLSDSDDSDGAITNSNAKTTTRPSGIWYRAETARMYSTPRLHSSSSQIEKQLSSRPRTLNIGPDRDEGDHDDLYTDPRDPQDLATPWSTGKRKRVDSAHTTPAGKLPRLNRAIEPTTRNNGDDIYTLPDSLAPSSGPASLLRDSAFGKRSNTQESDPDYIPSRDVSVDTETEAEVDTDQALEEVIDLALRSISEAGIPSSCNQNGNAEIPRTPSIRRDSVIPDPITPEGKPANTVGAFPKLQQSGTEAKTRNDISFARSTPIAPKNTAISSYSPGQEEELRLELFKLILSRIHDINEFSSQESTHDAEQRLNQLLFQFWLNDMESIQAYFGDRFSRFQKVFDCWNDMRFTLHEFQTKSKYHGKLDSDWKEHLRTMPKGAERARTCIALADLKMQRSRINAIVDERFNDDLSVLFDQLTKFEGCDGSEEFGGVNLYNERLLQWFR